MGLWPLLLVFLFFVFSRIFPYLFNSIPLGYDPGLYLYLFKKYSQVPFSAFFSFPQILAGDFPPVIAILGKILSGFFSPERLLIPTIISSQVFLLFSLFLFAKKVWDKNVALWIVFIFSCSAVMFRFYWFYYLSNVIALSFALLTFYFISSKSWWAILFSVLAIYCHRPVAVFLLATLFVLLLDNKKQRRYLASVLTVSIISALAYYIPTFEKTILPLIKPFFTSFVPQRFGGSMGTPSGTFYTLPEAFVLSIPYLFFGFYGFLSIWKKEKLNLVTIPTLLAILIIFLRVYLFRRFIPFFDLFLIMFAGYGASLLFKKKSAFLKLLYIGALIIFISIFMVKTGKSLIYEDELKEIRKLSQTEPEAYVLVTDNYYTPWVYGWSDRKPIAPGFGEYDIYWTIPEWHQFWESDSREAEKQLLLKLPKPLYIYKGDLARPAQTDFSGDCFERINWRTYKFVCNK